MLTKRHGQAKILTPDEIKLLLKVGFVSARDQAFFMFCFYTACRLSEARQMCRSNVFYNNSPDNFKSPTVECGFQHHH